MVGTMNNSGACVNLRLLYWEAYTVHAEVGMNQSCSSVSGGPKKLPHVQTYKAQRILFGNPLDWDQYNKFRQLDKKERRAGFKLK